MTEIVLNEEQTRLVDPNNPVVIRDCFGNLLGQVEPFGWTPDEISEAKSRASSAGPWYSSEQVQAQLRAVAQAYDREGGIDIERAREVVKEARLKE